MHEGRAVAGGLPEIEAVRAPAGAWARGVSEFLAVLAVAAWGLVPVIGLPWAWRRGSRLGRSLVVLYVLSYVGWSATGRYVTANHGGQEWRIEWCPAGLVTESVASSGRTRARLTVLGVLYWPGIMIDRLVWHRSILDHTDIRHGS